MDHNEIVNGEVRFSSYFQPCPKSMNKYALFRRPEHLYASKSLNIFGRCLFNWNREGLFYVRELLVETYSPSMPMLTFEFHITFCAHSYRKNDAPS